MTRGKPPPAVEDVRGEHQPQIHQPVVRPDEQVDGIDDQKENEEDPGVEKHKSP